MEICLGLRNKDKSISLKKLILLLKKQKFADLLSFIFQMSQRDFLSTNTKGTLLTFDKSHETSKGIFTQ